MSKSLLTETLLSDFQDFLIAESKQKEYGGFKYLKDHQVKLTPEEREQCKNNKGFWDGKNNDMGECGIHKQTGKDGSTVYFCYTHRQWQCRPSLKGAISAFQFIKTTS